MPLHLVPGTDPFLPLVACHHRFVTSSTSQHRQVGVPSVHSKQLIGGLMTVNHSPAPRRTSCQPAHLSHLRRLTPPILRIVVPRPKISLGPPPRPNRVRYSFLRAYPSTVWITFGTSIRMVANKMGSGKVSTRVHSNTIRRFLSHYLISLLTPRASDRHE